MSVVENFGGFSAHLAHIVKKSGSPAGARRNRRTGGGLESALKAEAKAEAAALLMDMGGA